MKVLAVDYGKSRTGIALSDISRTLTGETFVIRCKKMQETVNRIAAEAKARGVSCIVVGYPKNMDGSLGAGAKSSEQLAALLRETSELEVVLWDERLTTKDAHRILTDAGKYGKKRKNIVDAVAASLILESYLGFLKSQDFE